METRKLIAEFRSLAARLDSLDPNALTPAELQAVEDLLRQLWNYYDHQGPGVEGQHPPQN